MSVSSKKSLVWGIRGFLRQRERRAGRPPRRFGRNTGVSHRVPWKRGALALAEHLF